MLSLALAASLTQVPAAPPTLSPMFGSFVLGVGDIDGDATPDFLIGDEGWKPSGSPPAFWVLSGEDAHEIHAFHAVDLGPGMPSRIVAAGDVDSDGHADLWLILAERDELGIQRVVLWSGKSRAVVRAAEEGERGIALTWNDLQQPLGDVDGDGVKDWIERLGGTNVTPMLNLRSGADSKRLWSAAGSADRLMPFDDVNGDGVRDLLCTDPRVGIAQGIVRCLSGRDGKTLWNAGDDYYWYFGWMIDVVGDLDHDGIRDWIVGGSNHRSHYHGRASLRSGRTGVHLATFQRRERATAVTGPMYAEPR